MSVDVSIIIVSYNARELLDECLAAVASEAYASGRSVELIVVDNESSDGSAQHVRDAHPDVRLIESGRNAGMGAGNNVGMSAATGRLLLLLNSDAFLQPGSLAAMCDAFDAAPGVGLVGPRLRNRDGSLQRSVRGFPTPWRLATEFFYLRRIAPRSRLFNAFYGGGFAHDRRAPVEWLMGACMLTSRKVVEQVGLMNEAYFMFNEETDWQRRMHDAGLQVLFVPEAEVVHLGGGSTAKQWGRMYQVQLVSHLRYLATRVSLRSARRARRMMLASLALRQAIYSVAATVFPRARAARRERARTFGAGRAAVAAARVETLGQENIPEL